MSEPFVVGFVSGVMPDKWAQRWAERRRRRLSLEVVPETEAEQAIRSGALDMCLVRGAIGRDGMHLIPLYVEQSVIVVGREHPAAAYDELPVGDLADDIDMLVANPGISLTDAVATVATGTGFVVVPRSVARVHARKDVVAIDAVDAPEHPVGLAWLIDHDDEDVETFIGIVRGRSVRSSRG